MREQFYKIRAKISKHTLTVRVTLFFTLPILLLFSCKVMSDCGLNFCNPSGSIDEEEQKISKFWKPASLLSNAILRC